MQTREAYVKELIRRRYRHHAADCAAWGGRERAIRAGYDGNMLDRVPAASVERWAGCGNVVAEAPLADATVVVDLGAGSGVDGLLIAASSATAPTVISIDLTPELLAHSGTTSPKILPVAGDFEMLPLGDAVCDVVIANAAFNLALDPELAFAEAWRILRPGGRLHICDLVREGELPSDLLADPLAWSASLGGVLPEDDLVEAIVRSGFSNVSVTGHRPFDPVVAVRIDAIKPFDRQVTATPRDGSGIANGSPLMNPSVLEGLQQ